MSNDFVEAPLGETSAIDRLRHTLASTTPAIFAGHDVTGVAYRNTTEPYQLLIYYPASMRGDAVWDALSTCVPASNCYRKPRAGLIPELGKYIDSHVMTVEFTATAAQLEAFIGAVQQPRKTSGISR